MSVLSCSRKGCDNVMCDTYVPSAGYICRDCQKEFKNYLRTRKDVFFDSRQSILNALKDFMGTGQGDFDINQEIDIDDFFRPYTQD